MPTPDASGRKPPEVRKGQGDVKLSREEFARRLRERFYDPAFDAVRAEIDRIVEVAWTSYDEYHKSPRKRKAGPGFADPEFELPVEWLEAREPRSRRPSGASATRRRPGASCWSAAPRGTTRPVPARCRRRSGWSSSPARSSRRARLRVRPARPEPSHRAVRTPDPALQGVRLDRHAALPLALLLLSEPRHGPGERLDERDLSALGRRARRADRHAGVLVPGAERAEADDRPAGLRRRRQSRPDDAPTARSRKRRRRSSSRGWHYPRHLAGRAFAVVVHGDAEGAETLRRSLTDWLLDMELVQAGGMRHARPLHRLLRAVCHEPRGARPRRRACRRKSATRRAAWSTPCA